MKAYELIHLRFWDHARCETPAEAEPLKCDLFGALWKEDALSYYVVSWICAGDISQVSNDVFVVLKSTVISKRRLK